MVREDGILTQRLQTSTETTPETDLNASEKNYRKIAEKLALIVKEISDLKVPEKTIEDWRILSSSVCVVDYKVDKIADPTERSEFIRNIIFFLKGKSVDFSADKNFEKAMFNVKDLVLGLDEDQQRLFISSLIRTLKITEDMKLEKDPRKFVQLTRLEGQVFAKVYLPFLSEEFRKSPNYQKLVHVFGVLGRTANSVDNLIDLGTDYADKQTLINPTIRNRVLFMGGILSDGLEVLKTTGISKELIKTLINSLKNAAKDVQK